MPMESASKKSDAMALMLARYLRKLAREESPILFLAELDRLLTTTDDDCRKKLKRLFAAPKERFEPRPVIDHAGWMAQEAALAAMILGQPNA